MSQKTKDSLTSRVKHLLSQESCPSPLLILAPDEIRKLRFFELILERYLYNNQEAIQHLGQASIPKRTHDKLTVTKVDARDLSSQDLNRLGNDIACMSLFASVRFYLIHHLEDLHSELEKPMLELLTQVPPDCKLVLSSSKLPRAHFVFKILTEKDLIFDLEELKGYTLRRWVERELIRNGLAHFSPNAVDLFISLGDSSPDAITPKIEHLSLFCEGSSLSDKDITTVFVQAPSIGDFELVNALVEKKLPRAEELISSLFQSGTNPFMLMALLSRSFLNYLNIKTLLLEKRAPQDIRTTLAITPWVFNKHLEVARKYSLEQLGAVLKNIIRADSKLKNRSLGPEAILSELASSV